MSDISKITLPDGSEYDLKVYTDHIAPMKSKTFTGVIGVNPTTFNNATCCFGKITPIDYDVVWKIKYRLYADMENEERGKGYYEVAFSFSASGILGYVTYNNIKNTTYKPIQAHIIYRATQIGIENNYSHIIGERLYSSYQATSTNYTRTFKIDILECINCDFTFFDNIVLYKDLPGFGTENYDSYTELNGSTQGFTRNGTDNNDPNSQNRCASTAYGALLYYTDGGRYTICFSKYPNYILPITATDNVTNGNPKEYTTESFDPFGEIYYRSVSTAVTANALVPNSHIYRQILVDARYSFTGILNGATSIMSIGDPVYVVCTPQSNGEAKLYSNPLSFTLPSTEDGLMYILLGYAYSVYQFDLLIHHPVYMYKNGAVREVSGYAPYSGDAATVNGHTVASDVPSNAVFTDTTYSTATTTVDGLMSSTDKSKLDGIGTIPTKTSDLTNDSGYLTTETDPTVPAWAKAQNKPSYTAAEVGALPDNTVIPTKTSDITNDSGFITGMTILSYGSSTWSDFLAAYNANKVVYCRASSSANPATGSQTRLAFMAYVNNATNPTNVEFQYYRSVNAHSATQQGDQVYVYKLDKTAGWTVTVRECYTRILAGTNMSSSYSASAGTLTLNFNGTIPSDADDVGAIAAPSSATSGDFLVYNGSAWVAQSLSTWQGGNY